MSSRSSSFSKQRKRSSLSDSVANHDSRRFRGHSSFDMASSLAFAGGLAVLPQVRRASRERLSTIVSQDGDEREIAQKAKANLTSNGTSDTQQEEEEATSRRRSSVDRAQLHPSTRQRSPYSRQPSLAVSSPAIGQGYWTPLRPAPSYRTLLNYIWERQKFAVNNLQLLPAAPDGGWGWVVVVVAFITSAIVEGIAFSFAPILIHLTSENPQMMLQVLFMGATLIATYLLVCPIAMPFINAFGCRRVLFAGSLISTAGFILPYYLYAFSSGAPVPLGEEGQYTNYTEEIQPVNYNLLILSYGGIAGIGFGLMYMSALVAVSQYFELNRALAMGMALCGSGVGTLIYPPILSFFILDSWGFDGAAAAFAVLTLNGAVGALLLRPLRPSINPHNRPRKKNTQNTSDRVREPQRDVSDVAKSLNGESDHSMAASENNHDMVDLYRELRLRQLGNESCSSSRADLSGIQDDTRVTLLSESNGEHDVPLTINTDDPGDPDPQDSITRLKERLAGVLPPPAILAAARSEKSLPSLNRAQVRQQQLLAMNKRFQVVTSSQPQLVPGRRQSVVSKADLSRPFYRIDVLYGRSITHLPRCKREANLADYRAAAFQVPQDNWSPNAILGNHTSGYPGDIDQKSVSNTSLLAEIGRALIRVIPKPFLDPLRFLVRDMDLFRNSAFLRFALGSALCMMAVPLPYFVLPWWALVLRPHRSDEDRTSPLLASCLVSIIGGASMAGRLVSGFVADLPNMNVLLLHNVALAVTTVATFMAHLINQYGGLCVYAGIFGFCYAFHMALGSTVLGDTIGVERLTSAFGFVTILRGLAPLCTIPLLTLLLGEASYCVSERDQGVPDSCPVLPANSMPRAQPPNQVWWARVPPPPSSDTATIVHLADPGNAMNGYRHVLWLSGSLLFVASLLFASLHFQPGVGNNTSHRNNHSRSRSGSSRTAAGANGSTLNPQTTGSSRSSAATAEGV